jgi:hypothetical protein
MSDSGEHLRTDSTVPSGKVSVTPERKSDGDDAGLSG